MVVALLLMTSGATAQTAKEWLAEGKAKYEAGQMKEAAELYEKAANAGSVEAQFSLGKMYYDGEGVDKNYTTAAMWFKRAARKRNAKAEFYLANCYMNGNGLPVNYDKAYVYMKASALRGYKDAQKRMSELYAKGIMVEADQEKSDIWMAMYRGENVDISSLEEANPTKFVNSDSTATATTDPATTGTPAATTETPAATTAAAAAATDVATTAVTATPDTKKSGKNKKKTAENKAATKDAADVAATKTGKEGAAPADSTLVAANEEKSKLQQMLMSQPTELLAEAKDSEITPDNNALNAADVAMGTLLPGGNDTPASDTPATATTDTPPATTTDTPAAKQEVDDLASNGAPVIKILYPEDQSMFHTDVVKLKYQLLAQGLEAVTKITVMVDGVRQPETRAVKQANMLDVEVPNRDCTIMLFAQNEKGNSVPATIRLIRENVTQIDLPRLFAVCVGVSDYDDPVLPDLKMTTKDAEDFARAVESKKGHPFSDVQVKVLCDQEATRSDIFEAMQWMAQEARPNDLCMFFFAGHGYRDEKDRFYFVPFGGKTGRTYECFSAVDFKTAADEINSKFIIFADACYSAGLLEGNRSAAAAHFVEQLRRSKNGMLLFASSSGDTKSKEDPAWGNGAFTKALLEAFNGAARHDGDEGLSTRVLDAYLYDAVRKTTGFKQTPVFMNPSGIEHFNIFTYDK